MDRALSPTTAHFAIARPLGNGRADGKQLASMAGTLKEIQMASDLSWQQEKHGIAISGYCQFICVRCSACALMVR